MSTSTCLSCHNIFRRRLRSQIAHLEFLRRTYHATPKPLSHETLSWYGETSPPTEDQLTAASQFFKTNMQRRFWTATEWRKQDNENPSKLVPEVAFLGRSNVGKSSLLNALVDNAKLCHVGPRPGKTTTMNAWAIAPVNPRTGGAIKGMGGDMETKLAVLDMPGYGHASHDDWGQEIMTYLKKRKQLRRAFVLMDSGHGMKPADEFMLKLLREQGIPHQIIATKCDRLATGKATGAALKEAVSKLWDETQSKATGPGLSVLGEIMVVGSLGDGRRNEKVKFGAMKGVKELQWAVLRAAGLDSYAMQKAFPKKANKEPSILPQATLETQVNVAEGSTGGLPINTMFSISDIVPGSPPQTKPFPEPLPTTVLPSSAPVKEQSAILQELIARAIAAARSTRASNSKQIQAQTPLAPYLQQPIPSLYQQLSTSPPPHLKAAARTPGHQQPPQTASFPSNPSPIGVFMSMTQTEKAKSEVAATKSSASSSTSTGRTNNHKLSQLQSIYNPFQPSIGGMAELEALSSRSGSGGGRSRSKTPALNQGSRCSNDDSISPPGKRPAENTGSFTPGVGGMAELEALNSRTSSGGRGRTRKKPQLTPKSASKSKSKSENPAPSHPSSKSNSHNPLPQALRRTSTGPFSPSVGGMADLEAMLRR